MTLHISALTVMRKSSGKSEKSKDPKLNKQCPLQLIYHLEAHLALVFVIREGGEVEIAGKSEGERDLNISDFYISLSIEPARQFTK